MAWEERGPWERMAAEEGPERATSGNGPLCMLDGHSSDASGILIGRESAWMVLLKPEMSIEWLRGMELEGRVAIGSNVASRVSTVRDASGDAGRPSVRGEGRGEGRAAAAAARTSLGEMIDAAARRSAAAGRSAGSGSGGRGMASGGTASTGIRSTAMLSCGTASRQRASAHTADHWRRSHSGPIRVWHAFGTAVSVILHTAPGEKVNCSMSSGPSARQRRRAGAAHQCWVVNINCWGTNFED